MKRVIKLQTDSDSGTIWYQVGYELENGKLQLGEPQFGGTTRDEAIQAARNRFGQDYQVIN